jgi:hypothetical protein
LLLLFTIIHGSIARDCEATRLPGEIPPKRPRFTKNAAIAIGNRWCHYRPNT